MVWGKSEIDIHTFPMVSVLLFHPICIIWYTLLYGKCMGFPINFSQSRKMQQNPSNGVNLQNWYSYFSHSMCDFFPYDSHPMGYFIKSEMHGFPHQFPIVKENEAKPIIWGEPRKLVLLLLPQCGCFFPLDSHFMVYFITWEMHVFSH